MVNLVTFKDNGSVVVLDLWNWAKNLNDPATEPSFMHQFATDNWAIYQPVVMAMNAWEGSVPTITKALEFPNPFAGGSATAPAPGPAPADPAEALNEIAKAINKAEQTLNTEIEELN